MPHQFYVELVNLDIDFVSVSALNDPTCVMHVDTI